MFVKCYLKETELNWSYCFVSFKRGAVNKFHNCSNRLVYFIGAGILGDVRECFMGIHKFPVFFLFSFLFLFLISRSSCTDVEHFSTRQN